MSRFRIEGSGLEVFALSESGAIQKAVADGLNLAALEIREFLADATPKNKTPLAGVGVVAGDTAGRWTLGRFAAPGELVSEVTNDSIIALYLEYGTGVHSEFPGAPRQRIKPRKGKVLSWVDGDGDRIFAASVAGIKPVAMVRGNLGKLAEIVTKNVLEEVERVLDE